MPAGLYPSKFLGLEHISSHLLRDCISGPLFVLVFFAGPTRASISSSRPHEYGYTFAAAIRGLYLADFDGGARRMHRRMRPARLLLSIAVT
jgi:hypothetical protein